MDYTKRWITEVNGGSLFLIGDNVFETFQAIEIIQRTYLKDLQNPLLSAIDVEALSQVMMEDDDVQFWWALVCSSLDNDLSEVLLKKVVIFWITLIQWCH